MPVEFSKAFRIGATSFSLRPEYRVRVWTVFLVPTVTDFSTACGSPSGAGVSGEGVVVTGCSPQAPTATVERVATEKVSMRRLFRMGDFDRCVARLRVSHA